MARPRIFVSSTYYDLKHLRSSLENFVESLGYDAILSEKGQIAYTPEIPLDESCYREVGNADVFVLIIGGRYGSEASQGKTTASKSFFDRYNSVTRGEYQSALKRDVPTYILVEKGVYAEYQTFIKNKGNKTIRFAHVDSVNVFELIEDVLSQPRNNPVQQFERYSEIEGWLREQWAGLFREFLQKNQNQRQMASLQSQVGQLAELNNTFKAYLEEIISKIAPTESKQLISKEAKRLETATIDREINRSALGTYLSGLVGISSEKLRLAFTASSWELFEERIRSASRSGNGEADRIENLFSTGTRPVVLNDVNEVRAELGLARLQLPDSPDQLDEEETIKPVRVRRRSVIK